VNIVYEYSHLGGLEILLVRYPKIMDEVLNIIKDIKPHKTKISKEKTMRGKSLVAPKDLNIQFKEKLENLGFKELRDTFRQFR